MGNEACCGGSRSARSCMPSDWRCIYTVDGIVFLPDCASAIKVPSAGQDSESWVASLPSAVQEIMLNLGAEEVYKALTADIAKLAAKYEEKGFGKNGGPNGSTNGAENHEHRPVEPEDGEFVDVERLLVDFTPRLATKNVDLYLTRNSKKDSSTIMEDEWFVFVDRAAAGKYVPKRMVHALQKSSGFLGLQTSWVIEPTKEVAAEEIPGTSAYGVVTFAGAWLCTRVEGEMDTFLMELGMDRGERSAASAYNYGVQKVTEDIIQEFNRIEIQHKGVRCTRTMKIEVAAGEQRSVNLEDEVEDGAPSLVTPVWVEGGNVLLIKSKNLDDSPLPLMRRHVNDEDEMVVELTSHAGTVVKRIFGRQ